MESCEARQCLRLARNKTIRTKMYSSDNCQYLKAWLYMSLVVMRLLYPSFLSICYLEKKSISSCKLAVLRTKKEKSEEGLSNNIWILDVFQIKVFQISLPRICLTICSSRKPPRALLKISLWGFVMSPILKGKQAGAGKKGRSPENSY